MILRRYFLFIVFILFINFQQYNFLKISSSILSNKNYNTLQTNLKYNQHNKCIYSKISSSSSKLYSLSSSLFPSSSSYIPCPPEVARKLKDNIKGYDLYGRIPGDDFIFSNYHLTDPYLSKKTLIEVVRILYYFNYS